MKPVKLIIEVREDGKVYMTGPLHDKHLCNAMLDEAREIVKKFNPNKIIIPNQVINVNEKNK